MDYSAHSPPKEYSDIPYHTYAEHIQEVLGIGVAVLDYIFQFASISDVEKRSYRQTFISALMLHDMGKLDDANQPVLRGEGGKLAVDHIDAGVAVAQEMGNELLAWLIRGHHAPGLASYVTERAFMTYLRRQYPEVLSKYSNFSLRGGRHQRTKDAPEHFERHFRVITHTNMSLSIYMDRQRDTCGQWPSSLCIKLPELGLISRILLSCLVHADHSSAAAYSNQTEQPYFQPALTHWQKRFDALGGYIDGLVDGRKGTFSEREEERNKLRRTFYQRCAQGELIDSAMVACSAPVGLGKTTSVTSYLLRKAITFGASRLIVIAPFSNIIDQTVKTLRKAIVLPGEDPESTVVAHHHRADFSTPAMRQYSALWGAPIVVTTAVQFFETLNRCS